ncbi:hypothetical protein [Tistlia consotensis]|uniref:hypothetical protein n=1 Tax=Tistlia consotensis TaxID=1321365 RepID=UPI000A16B406|nr:hypothetical protein [Tistlia consotensis]
MALTATWPLILSLQGYPSEYASISILWAILAVMLACGAYTTLSDELMYLCHLDGSVSLHLRSGLMGAKAGKIDVRERHMQLLRAARTILALRRSGTDPDTELIVRSQLIDRNVAARLLKVGFTPTRTPRWKSAFYRLAFRFSTWTVALRGRQVVVRDPKNWDTTWYIRVKDLP